MAIIKCKMCGGDIQLAEDKTFGTCEYCGSVMTLPKISDEQRAAAFNRGNHFRRKGEFDKALSVYERIVAEDDDDAEAHWCCALCRFGIEYVEDPATYEWLPTCHRASFDSFLEDVDYKAALEHSDGITRRQYQKDAAKIAEVQRGILAASQNTEPYDVFISYKELDENGNRTRDSILAQDIYYQLQDRGWRVFFSRISLEDVPGTEYEPYIFAALNSAKVMVVVGTSAENLNAVWVKNEWSRYLSLMRKDRSRLLIPCYRDMDPYDLPEQLSVLASYDMGKIGFIQDLIRGVDKVLSAEKPREAAPAPAPVQERVIVQQSGGGPNVTALLKRGQQCLEDGDWEKAKDFYDQVLSMDAENADAFLGLALAESRSRDTRAYLNNLCSEQAKAESIRLPRDREHIDASLTGAVVPGYCERNELASFYDFDVNYPQKLPNEKTLTGLIRKRFDSDRNLARAFRYAQGDTKQKLEALRKELNERLEQRVKAAEAEDKRALEKAKTDRASKLKAADENTQERSRKAQEKREAEYQEACRLQENAETETDYWKARTAFINTGDYKDAEDRAAACAKKHQQLKEEKRAAEEREEAEHQKASRKIKIILAIVGAAAIAFVLLLTQVILPARKAKAQVKAAVDEYNTLFAAFEANDGWKEVNAITGFLDENDKGDVVMAEVLKGAEAGDPYAQYLAAYCYSNGACTDEDPELAFSWAQKSADQGNSYGTNSLGVYYLHGIGVAEDAEKGIDLYLKAAEMGNSIAMRNLGACYYYGDSVEQDYTKALKWLDAASGAGNGTASLDLARMYYLGSGVEADVKRSRKYTELAAEAGKVEAMYNLGAMYFNGEGGDKDITWAKYWFEKAAELGYPDAMNGLGLWYEATGDSKQAKEWYQKAKDAGYSG